MMAGMGKTVEDYYRENTGDSYGDMLHKYHPQVLSDFEEEMERWWKRRWRANNPTGKLRMVLLHRPGREFLSVAKPTPWPPHASHLGAWRQAEMPNLDEMIRDHENLVKAFQNESVEVVVRDPDPNDPPYQVKSIYCDDVCHPAVYGQVIFRMYDHLRRGEEVPTFTTLARIGCPVVGMVTGKGMIEGGSVGWLDEKHLVIGVHYARGNTREPAVMRANEFGHQQFAQIVKWQDPDVDIRFCPGYGGYLGLTHYMVIDKHTSVQDPKWLDHYLVDWMKAEMNWQFIPPPPELCYTDDGGLTWGPEVGVLLEPMKVLVPAGQDAARRWLESIGVKVVEVECSSLVMPRGTGTIHCCTGALIRDPENQTLAVRKGVRSHEQ
jgi:N-dimethylarginine dimethylaminohydrolase